MVSEPILCSDLCSGYLAPEYAFGGQLTMKADVYSFGVLLLETVSGRSSARLNWEGTPKLLLEWVRQFPFICFMLCDISPVSWMNWEFWYLLFFFTTADAFSILRN